MSRGLLAGCLLSVLLIVGCTSAQSGEPGEPQVFATTSIWADIVSNVACDADGPTAVGSLVGRGDDPHASTLTLAQRDALSQAELIVGNGLGLEPELASLLADIDAPSVILADLLNPGDVVEANPHFWMNPLLVASTVDGIADALIGVGFDRPAVEKCAEAYKDELVALDEELSNALSSIAGECQTILTNHHSLDYFTLRYGLVSAGAIIPSMSSMAEPSLSELDELAERLEDVCVSAVFVENGVSDRSASAFAERVGLPIVVINVEYLAAEGQLSSSYVGMMRENGNVMADALGTG